MSATLPSTGYVTNGALYMALELSDRKWRLGFSNGERRRQSVIEAGAISSLLEQIERAKRKLHLPADAPVRSCYEAGRDGFWLDRQLRAHGVDNCVVDSSSIEVSRRARRAKTDRLDAESLVRLLIRYHGGERRVWSVVRVPTAEEEDRRRMHRERERLLKERTAHRNRLRSLLVAQGVRLEVEAEFLARLERVELWDGGRLPAELKGELEREYQRLRLVEEQLKDLERRRRERLKTAAEGAECQVRQLKTLKGIGDNGAWTLVMEIFGWRRFNNRRELASLVGVTPMPYQSGESSRDQGISKAGNRRVRTLLIELSWLWLRYQRQSALTRWFEARFAHGGKRLRRIGIVAVARKLLIALWRYLETGALPEGALVVGGR